MMLWKENISFMNTQHSATVLENTGWLINVNLTS